MICSIDAESLEESGSKCLFWDMGCVKLFLSTYMGCVELFLSTYMGCVWPFLSTDMGCVGPFLSTDMGCVRPFLSRYLEHGMLKHTNPPRLKTFWLWGPYHKSFGWGLKSCGAQGQSGNHFDFKARPLCGNRCVSQCRVSGQNNSESYCTKCLKKDQSALLLLFTLIIFGTGPVPLYLLPNHSQRADIQYNIIPPV